MSILEPSVLTHAPNTDQSRVQSTHSHDHSLDVVIVGPLGADDGVLLPHPQ